jgi:hypothetical protein
VIEAATRREESWAGTHPAALAGVTSVALGLVITAIPATLFAWILCTALTMLRASRRAGGVRTAFSG